MVKFISLVEYTHYRERISTMSTIGINCAFSGYFVVSSGKAILGVGLASKGHGTIEHLGPVKALKCVMRGGDEGLVREEESELEEFLHKSPFKELCITFDKRIKLAFDGVEVFNSEASWATRGWRILGDTTPEVMAALVENGVTVNDVVDLGNELLKRAPRLGQVVYFYSKEKGLHFPW